MVVLSDNAGSVSPQPNKRRQSKRLAPFACLPPLPPLSDAHNIVLHGCYKPTSWPQPCRDAGGGNQDARVTSTRHGQEWTVALALYEPEVTPRAPSAAFTETERHFIARRPPRPDEGQPPISARSAASFLPALPGAFTDLAASRFTGAPATISATMPMA